MTNQSAWVLLGPSRAGNDDPWFVQWNKVNAFVDICYLCVESNKPNIGFRLLMWLYVHLCNVQINIFEIEFTISIYIDMSFWVVICELLFLPCEYYNMFICLHHVINKEPLITKGRKYLDALCAFYSCKFAGFNLAMKIVDNMKISVFLTCLAFCGYFFNSVVIGTIALVPMNYVMNL